MSAHPVAQAIPTPPLAPPQPCGVRNPRAPRHRGWADRLRRALGTIASPLRAIHQGVTAPSGGLGVTPQSLRPALRRWLCWVLPGLLYWIVPAHAAAPPEGSRTAEVPLTRYAQSVVKIEATILAGGRSVATLGRIREGSGVLIDPQTVVTIGYLIMEAERVQIQTASGRAVPATVVGYDHATGLGVLRALLPLGGRPLPLGDSDQIHESHSVLTIGQGETEATPLIVVSRKPFAGSWEYLLEQPIYTFPPVNNWSGSALISAQGDLIGIGSLIVEDATGGRSGVPGNLFVPVNLLKPILADLQTRGRSSRPAQPWLGLTTETIRGSLTVVRVAGGGPAELAGVEAGDIVVGVGGDNEQIKDQADFYRRIWKSGPAGTRVALRILHGGSLREVLVESVDRHDFLLQPAGI